ncbi:MAG TPA: putative glycoside hydrolase, partial [Chloroflexota bacterium]
MYSNRGWSYSSPASPPTTAAYRPRRVPRLPLLRRAFSPLPIVALLLAGVAWYLFAFPGFTVRGTVLDSVSGLPVPAARVSSKGASVDATSDGSFALDRVKPSDTLGIDAPGYRQQMLQVTNPLDKAAPRLEPIGVDIEAVDADTDQPIEASLGGQPPALRAHVAPVQTGRTFSLTADGYIPAEASYSGQAVLRVPLRPRLEGRVTDAATGKPVASARLAVGGQVLTTDVDGAYRLNRRPTEGRLVVLAPGYRRATLDFSQRPALDIALQPNPVRATYMTYFAIGGNDYRQDMYRLLDTTEINAVVIDVKGDYGLLSYRSRVPLAQQIGANDAPTIDDLDGLLDTLHQHNAYVIARIVVFKDNILARNGGQAGLDVGVRNRRTGGQWTDGEDLAWVDPFQPATWDYNTALAREAIERGFDEVQFDYIRFATDPSPDNSVDDIQYSRDLTEANRVAALKSFLTQAHQAVNDAGGFLSMDTFGYTTWWDNDGGIGQHLTILADHIDYYSPMVYPSTFSAGVPGL